jgi:hypothetical protein
MGVVVSPDFNVFRIDAGFRRAGGEHENRPAPGEGAGGEAEADRRGLGGVEDRDHLGGGMTKSRPGKRDAVCPSSPTPNNTRSKSGCRLKAVVRPPRGGASDRRDGR